MRPVVVAIALALACSACGQFHRQDEAPPTSAVAATSDPGRRATTIPTTPAEATTAPVPTTAVTTASEATTEPPATSAPAPTTNPPATTRPKSRPKPKPKPKPPKPDGPDLSAYAGLGTWIDHYDNDDQFGPQAFGEPAADVALMQRNGVRTVFLEAGSYKHPPVDFPEATAAFLRDAHAAGLKVVAWYLPLFRSVRQDMDEAMRVLNFRTADGQTYDGFALDIEAAIVPPERRIANFLRLSELLRRAVGPDRALGAIIPSPLGLIRVPTYWPGFPYDRLQDYYDVILPMSYFTFRVDGPDAVAQYVRGNVAIIRQETGDPEVPIHVIGGIADDMSQDETEAFVGASEAAGVFGASLYEFHRTNPDQWRTLAPLR